MKASIIGTGFMAETHAKALKELGYKVVYVVNRTLEKAAAFAKKWEIKNYGTELKRALNQVDCVHICTPPLPHYEIAKAALLKGKHVICEKPLTIDSTKAKELFHLAKKANLIAAVNFNIRFHEACQRAKSVIASKDFGKIHLIHGSYLQEFHASPTDYGWRYLVNEARQMRATTEIGSHWIDLVRYWTGLEITSVSANFANFNPIRYLDNDGIMHSNKKKNSQKVTINSEDAAIISFKFSNGAIGNVVLSEVSFGRNNRLSIEVTGNNQSIWWVNEDPYKLHTSQKSKGINTQINAFGGGFPTTFSSFFQAVYKDIEAGIPSQNPNYPTFYDGYINSKICAAIYQSAIHGGVNVSVG